MTELPRIARALGVRQGELLPEAVSQPSALRRRKPATQAAPAAGSKTGSRRSATPTLTSGHAEADGAADPSGLL